MSECIIINGIENLPLEQTLLIHYNIMCTGVWELAQLLSAYRNVCDTEWTVMYPNFQHPRHTDFPITVTSPGLGATFAWNYGGIRGIQAENFDESHSYLTQLSIFNYGCVYTGEEPTGQTGSSGEPPRTGIPPNTGYHNPGNGGGNSGPVPFPAEPPFPGGPGFPQQPGDPTWQSFSGTLPDPFFQDTRSGQQDPFYVPADTAPLPNLGGTIHPNDPRPTSTPFVNVGVFQDPSGFLDPIRTSDPRTTLTPSIGVYNSEVRSPFIPSTPSVSYGAPQVFGSTIDPNVSSPGQNIGSPRGTLTSTVIQESNISIENSVSLRQISTSRVIPGSYTHIELGSEEVSQGQTAIVGGMYQLPIGVEASAVAQLYILTPESTAYLLLDSPITSVSNSATLRIGGSIATSAYNIGQSTLVLLIKNISNEVIGVASRALIIRQPVQNGSSGASPRITSSRTDRLPQSVTNGGQSSLGNSVPITIPSDRVQNLILVPNNNDPISTVFVGDSQEVLYDISIINSSQAAISGGNVVFSGTRTVSDGPIVVNNAALLPESYTAGLLDVGTSGNIILTLSPSVTSTKMSKDSELYISESHSLKEWSSSVNGSTVTVQTPYAGEPVKLLVHGYVSGYIDENYTLYSATTSIVGVTTFTSVSIQPEHYYSLVMIGDGTYNPYKNIARTFIYEY